MPAAKTASPLNDKLAKLGLSAATAANKDNEIDFGFGGDLPAGINGGVAKLAKIEIGEYKQGERKGENYLRFAGVVVSPKVFNEQRIEGQQASIMIPLCDDKGPARGNRKLKTFREDYLPRIINELKLLGADEAIRQLPANCTWDHYMAIAAALVKSGPHFTFRTYAITDKPTPQNPNPEPGPTQTQFKGACKYDANDDQGGGVVDNSAGGTTEQAADEAVDWETVGGLADEGDADAQARIDAAVAQYGLSEQAATISYADAGKLIAEAEAGGGGEAAPEAAPEAEPEPAADAEPAIPQKGETWSYKAKGTRANPVEAEITVVFPVAKTCNIKILSGPKAGTIIRSVSFAELS